MARINSQLPYQLDDDGDVSDTDSLDAAMCNGDMSASSFKVAAPLTATQLWLCIPQPLNFKVHCVPVKRPNSAKKVTKKVVS